MKKGIIIDRELKNKNKKTLLIIYLEIQRSGHFKKNVT